MFDFIKLWNEVKDSWHKPSTPIAITIMIFIFFLLRHDIYNLHFYNQDNSFNYFSLIDIGLYISIFIIFIVSWFLTSRLPTNQKDKVGIIIAIPTENETEKNKLKIDFITQFEDIITDNNKNNDFALITYPEYYSNKINKINAQEYLNKSNAHFMMHGSFKKRNANGKPSYIFTLNALVAHAPIPAQVSKLFAQEFRAVFPRQITVDENFEFEGIDIVSKWVGLVTKYIIAKAALISNDTHLAFRLLNELYSATKSIKTNIPSINSIRSRIPLLISITSEYIAGYSYDKYCTTKEIRYLHESKKYLDIIKVFNPTSYKANLILSIYYFLVSKNIDMSLRVIDKCQTNADCIWLYNKAFLLAYRDNDGDLSIAEKCYKKAFRINTSDMSVIPKIEEFINDIIEKEPSKHQLHYCLGLINYFVKEDLSLATDYFNKFLNNDNSRYPNQTKKANEYINQIIIKQNQSK